MDTKICSECGRENNEDSVYCSNCGNKLYSNIKADHMREI